MVHDWVREFKNSALPEDPPSKGKKKSLNAITFDNIHNVRVFLTDIVSVNDFLEKEASAVTFVAHAPGYKIQNLRELLKRALHHKAEQRIKEMRMVPTKYS